jgi:glycosyltransferase involved in cell wall biosynthesis
MARVTIGMPVYNGALYVEDAVRSLLEQSERDILIDVYDDGSTDETALICERLAREDSRVRCHKDGIHRGMTENFRWAAKQAGAPYFMWAAQDDLWQPTYIETTLALLEHNPDAVGSLTGVKEVNERGELLRTYSFPHAMGSPHPIERVRAMQDGGFMAMYGLYRREVFAEHLQFPDTFGPDIVLVFSQLLWHRYAITAQPLMTRRILGYDDVPLRNGRLVWRKALGPDGHLYTPRPTAMCRVMLREVTRSNLSLASKMSLWIHVVVAYWWWVKRTAALRSSRSQVAVARSEGRYLTAGLLGLRHALLRPRRALSELRRLLRVP